MIYILYITSTLALALYYASATIIRLRRRKRIARLRHNYILEITAASLPKAQTALPRATSRHERIALLEALHTLTSHSYDIDSALIHSIARANRLEGFILRRLDSLPPHRRGEYLLFLGIISASERHTPMLERTMHSDNPHLRSCALVALLSISPKDAISTLSAVEFDLRPFDIMQIILLLRRGALPLAIEPLLESQNPNLNRLGLAIVRTFGLNIVAAHIYDLTARSPHLRVVDDAILTLATLKCSLHRQPIRQRLATMSTPQRKALCRHLSVEGYSPQRLQNLFPQTESEYATRFIASYKRELAHT